LGAAEAAERGVLARTVVGLEADRPALVDRVTELSINIERRGRAFGAIDLEIGVDVVGERPPARVATDDQLQLRVIRVGIERMIDPPDLEVRAVEPLRLLGP